MTAKKTKCIGLLTSGGDCPGLNAAIRGVAKVALAQDIRVIGFLDGFRGLVENRHVNLDDKAVSGILTVGGTILGTSRDKPAKMKMGDKILDMTEVAASNAHKLDIDVLVCMGGNGTQKNAMHLHDKGGLDVVTLPKTIDNDVAGTDISFGFNTAMAIATEAIDRLHTTATSHHRVIICEIMGHKAGWLTLGAGVAGGADVILIPEIPYDINVVAEHIRSRRRHGKRFSIVAVAEGARSIQDALENGKKKKNTDKTQKEPEPVGNRVARELLEATGIDCRVTALGHVQRGGGPTAADRLLCTRLGTTAGLLLKKGTYNVMAAIRNGECLPVDLAEVAGKTKLVPADHHWIKAARLVDTCLGV